MILATLTCYLTCVLGTRVNFVASGSAGFRSGATSGQLRPRETRMAAEKKSISMEALMRRVSLKEEVENAATDLFKLIDVNSDGQISKHEMKTAYYKKKSREQTKVWNTLKLSTFRTCMELVADADIDGDGKVNLEEFKMFLAQAEGNTEGEIDAQPAENSLVTSLLNDDDDALFEMLNLFGSIDRDSDGQLSLEELRTLASRSSVFRRTFNLADSDNVVSFMEDADSDGDGTLTFDEFKSYLVSSCANEFGQYMDIMANRKYRGPLGNGKRNQKVGVKVVILREVDDELQVLVQQHSSFGLATIGGRRESTDETSKISAMRMVAETGLMDIAALYKDVPGSLLRDFEIPRPRFLKAFGETPQFDWWVLLLDGPGVFKTKSTKVEAACEDVTSLLSTLPDGSDKADTFGHVWIPVKSLNMLPESIRTQGGSSFKSRIFQAAVAANRAKKLYDQRQTRESFEEALVDTELSSFFGVATPAP